VKVLNVTCALAAVISTMMLGDRGTWCRAEQDNFGTDRSGAAAGEWGSGRCTGRVSIDWAVIVT
jgi:hypothetical protein